MRGWSYPNLILVSLEGKSVDLTIVKSAIAEMAAVSELELADDVGKKMYFVNSLGDTEDEGTPLATDIKRLQCVFSDI